MPTKQSIVSQLIEIKRNVWCVYKNGKVVIITTQKKIAERHANGTDNSKRDRSTKDTS
jgi:hypothetical protein